MRHDALAKCETGEDGQVRYMIRQTMGHSHIFDVMFPGDPRHAYLVNTNTMAENALVTAYVLAHADFSKNNQLFARHHEMAGGHIVEQAAAHAKRVEQAFAKHGIAKVEAVMDAALALEPHVDASRDLHCARYAAKAIKPEAAPEADFQAHFATLPGESGVSRALPEAPLHMALPPHLEYDLLWSIANYAPELDEWERDNFLAVRESIIANKFDYGSPGIAVTEMKSDGSLILKHDHSDDGRGLTSSVPIKC